MARGDWTFFDLPFVSFELAQKLGHDPVTDDLRLFIGTEAIFIVVGQGLGRGQNLGIVIRNSVIPDEAFLLGIG